MDKRMIAVILGILTVFLEVILDEEEHQPRSEMAWVFLCLKTKEEMKMAANVETMFYTRTAPWHGLGTKVLEALTSSAARSLAGLDWKVIQKPLNTEDGIPVPGFKATKPI